MTMEYSIVHFLSEPLIKKIFTEILESRRKSRYQIEIDTDGKNIGKINEALYSLEKEGLIKKNPATNSKLDTFFPTGKGLYFEKYVR